LSSCEASLPSWQQINGEFLWSARSIGWAQVVWLLWPRPAAAICWRWTRARRRRAQSGTAADGNGVGRHRRCTAYDVVLILKRGRHDVTGCQIKLTAERAPTEPKVFTAIHMHFVVTGRGLKQDVVERAVALSHEKYCSASIMLGKTAVMTTSVELVEGERKLRERARRLNVVGGARHHRAARRIKTLTGAGKGRAPALCASSAWRASFFLHLRNDGARAQIIGR